MTKVKCPKCGASTNMNIQIVKNRMKGSKICASCGYKMTVDDFV